MVSFWRQLRALQRKNQIIRRRNLKSSILQVTQAITCISFILIIDSSVQSANKSKIAFRDERQTDLQEVTDIPLCQDYRFILKDRSCHTLLYTPNNSDIVDNIIGNIMETNQPNIPLSQVIGFSNMVQADEYLFNNSQTVLAAAHFFVQDEKNIGFIIQTNTSVNWFKGKWMHPNLYVQLPLQNAIEREVTKIMTNQSIDWNVGFRNFPHPPTEFVSIVGLVAPTFLLTSACIQLLISLQNLVSEKESGVRMVLHSMGLQRSAYWGSVIMGELTTVTFNTIIQIIMVNIFRFQLFTENSQALVLMYLFLFNISMACLGLLLSSFIRKGGYVASIGFAIFIFGWINSLVVNFGFPFTPKFDQRSQTLFKLFPWALLAKGFQDFGDATAGNNGISWERRLDYCVEASTAPTGTSDFFATDCTFPIGQHFQVFLFQCILYIILAFYFDAVLPNDHGIPKSPFYYLTWIFRSTSTSRTKKLCQKALKTAVKNPYYDVDVANEKVYMIQKCQNLFKFGKQNSETQQLENDEIPKNKEWQEIDLNSPNYDVQSNNQNNQNREDPVIKIFGLKKQFKRQGKKHVAIDGTWLGINRGECFCLLGHNGAGKTSTINCLTGNLRPSGGEILTYNKSISDSRELSQIQQFTGICPQFDVLWNDLTAREHIYLFSDIRGLPHSQKQGEAAALLEMVQLSKVGDDCVGTYSGGMKRRLSVALALVGNPQVVYLDEPSSGMDPVSRRYVWDLLAKVKKDRVLVLTTHSMEEADILGDRIAIMAKGKIRCLGSSLHLKNRFGQGQQVHIDFKESSNIDQIQQILEDPNYILKFQQELSQNNMQVEFSVPQESESKLPELFKRLKNLDVINEVQCHPSGLEDVFLSVSQQSEKDNSPYQDLERLTLNEESVVVKVPRGASWILGPKGNLYQLTWCQDNDGSIVLKDYKKHPKNQKILDIVPTVAFVEQQL